MKGSETKRGHLSDFALLGSGSSVTIPMESVACWQDASGCRQPIHHDHHYH
jgi:hypothetical protein